LKTCQTPECAGKVELAENYNLDYFPCPVCRVQWCLKCNAQRHQDLGDCAAAAAVRKGKVEEKADLGETGIKPCPKCKTLTEKNNGCNHMTCMRCKQDWCYSCGKTLEKGKLEAHYSESHLLFTEDDVVYKS